MPDVVLKLGVPDVGRLLSAVFELLPFDDILDFASDDAVDVEGDEFLSEVCSETDGEVVRLESF